MSQHDAHEWWSRLRHQGLLLSPVVMLERYPSAPEKAAFHAIGRLRNAYTRFASTAETRKELPDLEQPAILGWVDTLLEHYVGHTGQRLARQHHIPDRLTAVVRVGSRSDTLRPHRVVYADDEGKTPALLVMADTSPQVGRGRGRTVYARLLELLRGTGHRLGLLTNGHQFRLVYAGLDFESWCEWEADRWFDDGGGTEELNGLRQLLSPASLKPAKEGVSGLLDAVEESRKRQADLSSVLRENVRQAVELLLEEVSAANRTNDNLFAPLVAASTDHALTDPEAHEALFQATVRVVMRLVVCLFAESRGLLPVNDPIYAQAYGVRSLYELLEEAARNEGGTHVLLNRNAAWPRLMALFRLIHGGSAHGAFPLRAYSGVLFRPGDPTSGEPVARALHLLEHAVTVCDATIHGVLRKLLRGPLPVLRGRAKTFVEGPVDYTDLRTEFIGLIYEGLLDYRLKRTDEKIGPQVFLNLGREPVLPLSRLEDMLANDKKGLKELLTTLRKEQVTASAGEDDGGEEEEEDQEPDQAEEEAAEEPVVEAEAPADEGVHGRDYLDAVEAARRWGREAVVLAGLVGKQGKRETNTEYQNRIEAEANRLIKRVVAVGEFYLVRAGNTRKGTGTFYTRPQLAVPTVHRTLEPLCYVVDGRQWTVDSENQEKNNGDSRLQTTGSLAEGDGPGDTGLSTDQSISERGNLRTDESITASGSVRSVEHRRGPGTPDDQGVPQSSVDCQGIASGGSDSNRDCPASGLPDIPGGRGSKSTADDGSKASQRTDERSAKEGGRGPVNGGRVPRKPEEILALKVCDPACGSASFLVAALHYLTNALYDSLKYHCQIEDPVQAARITLPYGHLRSSPSTVHRPLSTELLPFPPDDPQRGHTFEERVKALLRRHVVERCVYGVDINALAVELARVSLWVETLDPELPFSFLDHKIKVGNSLVGCWLDRVLDYPLKAWEREGGDGKDGPRTQRIETFLKGEKRGNKRTGDGVVKREMRHIIESRFKGVHGLFEDDKATPEAVVAQERTEYERLHDLPVGDPDERERYYREQVENSPSLLALKRAMDEWCAVWFWPTDEESLKHVPTPGNFHHEIHEKHEIVQRLKTDLKFFHWEIEFPDVFSPERSQPADSPSSSFSSISCLSWSGFDAMIGNPPWDVMKPNSQEFFTEFDPLYRTYDKQAALRKQKELFATVPQVDEQWGDYNARFKALGNWARNAADPFDVTLARGREGESLKAAWQRHREGRVGFADARHPFRLQGSADLNSYKMFAEVFWNLLRNDGRLGVILPTGIYSDFGTKDLREELLLRGRLDFLYAFQNEKKIFVAADHRFKQTAVFATKGGSTKSFRTRFRMGVGDSPEAQEIPDDILGKDDAAMVFTPDDVRANSPKTLSLVELKSQRDLDIFRKIYAHSIRIGDNAPGWEISYAREFDMTNDSKHFPPLEKWEAKGYKPDVFGRWVGPDGDVALPFYQGVSINQFDFSQKGWEAGLGRSAVWRDIPFDGKTFRPKFLIGVTSLQASQKYYAGSKLAYRRVARSTDTRSFISCVVVGFGCGDKLPVLKVRQEQLPRTLHLAAVCNSLTFDYVARTRNSGTQIDWHILAEFPLPSVPRFQSELVKRAARLTFLHRRFAPEWLRLKHLYPELAAKEWKHWWAVTEADRLRLRVEIDALCADLYGLSPDDFDWIVRDDPTDPKGFYRVDRHLPFRERLTGLAAAAFRALKEGRWTVDGGQWTEKGETLSTVHRPLSTMSNDEFFALIGIPEMTTGPDPLIRKRDGCHRWKPEEFGPNDPRHGWTWDDCWNDAVALLGSEDAVRKYVEGTTEDTEDTEEEKQEKTLFD